jgi:N-acyl-D-amino-acid deacylase
MYSPGTFVNTKELISMAKKLSRHKNTIYSSHLRGYSHTYIESIEEAIEISKQTGIPVQCSHLGPFGIQFGPKIPEALSLIEKANNSGLPVQFDTLAYCGGSTTIMALIPPWAYENGIDNFLNEIKNYKFFYELIKSIEDYIPKWPSWEGNGWTDNFIKCLGWDNLYVLGTQNKDYVGKNFIQIAEANNIHKSNALRKILLEEKGNTILYMAGVGSCKGKKEEDDMEFFDMLVEHPLGLVTVDAIFNKGGRTMPYAYGTFPRIIDRYVKNKKSLTIQDAIKKFTCNAAKRFNISDRGYLKENTYADIIIFDLENMKDYPDMFSDNPPLSKGVEYIFINGKCLIDNGVFNGSRNGRVIKNIN